jgi:predicted HicB family RNase H-like nuclease
MRQSIHIRLPRALHEELSRRAVDQDISLNGLIATLLAGAVGFSLANEDTATKGTQ